jgi:hypothetical protein
MRFKIIPADTFIWNLSELVDFLIEHQNQDIVITNGTEGCCSTTIGLYKWLDKFKFSNVTIETGNILEIHNQYKVSYVAPWKFLEIARPIDQAHHIWNRQSIFGTLYGRPLWHRIGIASHLISLHKSISEIGCLVTPVDPNHRELFEILELWKYDPNSLIKFSNVFSQFPCYHQDVDQYTPGATLTDGFVKQTERVYKNFLIDVVAETYTSGDCFFVTEKTIRPMLLKKSMILMGSKDCLNYLRQMGFRTFGDFWDETYDGYEGRERYLRILDLIDWIAGHSYDQLETMYWDMQYTLDHNYNLLMTQGYNKTVTKLS